MLDPVSGYLARPQCAKECALPASALPWLLVYDNADDAKALKKFLPHAGAHHVLITSHLPTWAGMGALNLDVWTGTQALAFLQPRLTHESEDALLALADTLDGLPLALEQACAYLGNNHISIADYIERLNLLGHDALCQAPLLMQADFMGNNGVSQRCLVLHRLTQTAVRAWLGQKAGTGAGGPEAGGDGCKHVIMLLSGVFPYRADYPEHWPRCRSLMPHVQRLAAFYAKDKVALPRYAYLLGQLATYLTYGPGLLPEALRMARFALAIKQTALGEKHPDTLTSMDNLATTLRLQGNLPDARLLQERTLASPALYPAIIAEQIK